MVFWVLQMSKICKRIVLHLSSVQEEYSLKGDFHYLEKLRPLRPQICARQVSQNVLKHRFLSLALNHSNGLILQSNANPIPIQCQSDANPVELNSKCNKSNRAQFCFASAVCGSCWLSQNAIIYSYSIDDILFGIAE